LRLLSNIHFTLAYVDVFYLALRLNVSKQLKIGLTP
jgi:hypothetical protein